MCVRVGGWEAHVAVTVWKPEDTLWELVLFLYYVSSVSLTGSTFTT